MLNLFKRKRNVPTYEYGYIRSGTRVRRNVKTGVVEFVLWKAGEMGHTEDCWHTVGAGWAQTFVRE